MTPIRTALLLSLLAPAPAAAQAIDRIEHTFGVTAMTAMSGNGGLSVGLSERGEITVLSWPSPSFHDHVDHTTANGEDARDLPLFGAEPDRGVFTGIAFDDGSGPTVSWVRDAEWEHEQAYVDDTSAFVRQAARHSDNGISVFEFTGADRDRDVLLRRTTVQRADDSPLERVTLLAYSNLAPQLQRPADLADLPVYPPPEASDDSHDFLAFWDAENSLLVHLAPEEVRRDTTLLTPLLAEAWDEAMWADQGLAQAREFVRESLGDGVYLAIAPSTTPDGVQVGFQNDRPCSGGSDFAWTPQSAWDDAQDGVLSGSPVAGCHANAVFAWTLEFGAPGTHVTIDVDWFLAAASNHDAAVELAGSARDEGFDRAAERTDAAWDAWVSELATPDNLGAELVAFSQRTLIALKQGMDRETGAMVASIARQPGYSLDWPRDSTFFNLALDVAGAFDDVRTHNQFLHDVQNREPVTLDLGGPAAQVISPPGAWLMNFWADGQPSTASLLNTFEIDEVGLMMWNYVAHAAFAGNDNLRRDELAAHWGSIERGANLLAACVADDHPAVGDEPPAGFGSLDWWPVYAALLEGTAPDADARLAALASNPASMLPCTANEDDNPVPSVSVYSTHTTRLGLLAAVEAARLLCIDTPQTRYWQERAHELAAVALLEYYDADTRTWADGRLDWLLWPYPLSIDDAHADLFDDADALVDQALDDLAARLHAEVDDAVSLSTAGAAYENKKTLNLARWWSGANRPAPELWVANVQHIEALGVDLAVPGTRHVGEVFVSLDDDGDGVADRAEQRVAVPHLWAATLTYLSAMAVSRPDLFEPLTYGALEPVCATGEEPVLARGRVECSECESSVVGRSSAPFGLALLALFLVRRRRD